MDSYVKKNLRKNGDIFRNTLERIVEKYSRIDGSGVEVCLQSMTCRTEEGIRPWDEKEVERQMKIADSMEGLTSGQNISGHSQLNDSQTCSDSTSTSVETKMERSTENVSWESGLAVSRLHCSAVSECSQQGEAALPEEQEEELERTLSSQGSVLLELYPSMLLRLEQAWRRQRVKDAANAVLRRYRRRGWHSSSLKTHPHVSALKPHPHISSPKPHTSSPKPHPHISSPKPHPHPHFSSPKPHPHFSSPKPHPLVSSPKPHPLVSSPKPHPLIRSPKLHPHLSSPKPNPHISSPKPHPHPHISSPKPLPHISSHKPLLHPLIRPPKLHLHPHISSPHPLICSPKPHPHLRSPRSPHESGSGGHQEGGAGQGADPVLVTDRGSFPEELSPLSRTYMVSSPSRPMGGTLHPKSCQGSTHNTLQPHFQQHSPQSSYLRHSPWRLRPPDGSHALAQPPGPSPWHQPGPALVWPGPAPARTGPAPGAVWVRRHSFSGFQASRHQIDLQFEELYQRLVCQRRSTLSVACPSSSSSSLAALALSPLRVRVGKRERDRALEPSAPPQPKRFREEFARLLRQSPPTAPSPSRLRHPAFRKDLCAGPTPLLHRSPAASSDQRESHSLPQSAGKSPVRANMFVKDRQRGFSPSSSRRRLLYGPPLTPQRIPDSSPSFRDAVTALRSGVLW